MHTIAKLPKMRIGTDDFYDLIINSELFVDKSLLIKELLEDSSKVMLITRPRRWGKSLNMSMLQRFFEIEVDQQGNPLTENDRIHTRLFLGGTIDLKLATGRKKLLQPLQIAAYSTIISDYQGQFPVILLNLKDVKGNSYRGIEEGVKTQIIKAFMQHRYLKCYITENVQLLDKVEKDKLNNFFIGHLDQETLKDSLRFLSELLYKHFNQKVYILIDEYDTPINSSYIKVSNKPEEFEEVLELFRGMFGSALKSNPYLEKGVITGILRIAKANLFSDLNNITEYTLLDEAFASCYGFTQAEVDELFSKVNIEVETERIKNWYNGYTFGGEIIYNPWSIMQCVAHKGKLDYYWIDSGGTGLVDKALLADEMQADLQALVAGNAITWPIVKQISFEDIYTATGLWSLLLFSGYLNPALYDQEEQIYQLSIPNKEVSYIYKTRMLQWVTDQLDIDRSSYYSFVHLLPAGRIKAFKEKLQDLLSNATSFHQTGSTKAELFYSGFMLGMLHMLASDYIIESERETGSGRADMLLIPQVGRGDNALIIEYKIAKNKEELDAVAQAGLQQIIAKQYDLKVRSYPHVKKITKIAMAFCGKEMALVYQVE